MCHNYKCYIYLCGERIRNKSRLLAGTLFFILLQPYHLFDSTWYTLFVKLNLWQNLSLECPRGSNTTEKLGWESITSLLEFYKHWKTLSALRLKAFYHCSEGTQFKVSGGMLCMPLFVIRRPQQLCGKTGYSLVLKQLL